MLPERKFVLSLLVLETSGIREEEACSSAKEEARRTAKVARADATSHHIFTGTEGHTEHKYIQYTTGTFLYGTCSLAQKVPLNISTSSPILARSCMVRVHWHRRSH